MRVSNMATLTSIGQGGLAGSSTGETPNRVKTMFVKSYFLPSKINNKTPKMFGKLCGSVRKWVTLGLWSGWPRELDASSGYIVPFTHPGSAIGKGYQTECVTCKPNWHQYSTQTGVRKRQRFYIKMNIWVTKYCINGIVLLTQFNRD